MKLIALSRFIGAASVGALLVAGVPALSAQTAAQLNTSGLAKSRDGNLDGAIADFTAAIAQKPGEASLYVNRAMAETGQGNYGGATDDYTQVIKLKPSQANGYLLRGLVNFLKGDLQGAVQDYSKAIELQPNDPTLYLYLVLVADCQNNPDGAVAQFSTVVERTPGGDSETANYAQIYRALDLRRRGADVPVQLDNYASWKNPWTKAIAAYLSAKVSEDELVKRAGTDVTDEKAQNREKAEAYYFSGRVHLLAGDTAGARTAFNSSLALQFPADVERKLAQVELDRMPAAVAH